MLFELTPKMLFSDITEQFNLLPENPCTAAVRARWELQITRHGQRLSECLLGSVAEVRAWNDFVNTVHHTSQATTNQVANAGVAELTDRDSFTGRDSLYGHINDRFRSLLRAARPYLDTFEEFRASVVDNEEEVIQELTSVSYQRCL